MTRENSIQGQLFEKFEEFKSKAGARLSASSNITLLTQSSPDDDITDALTCGLCEAALAATDSGWSTEWWYWGRGANRRRDQIALCGRCKAEPGNRCARCGEYASTFELDGQFYCSECTNQEVSE